MTTLTKAETQVLEPSSFAMSGVVVLGAGRSGTSAIARSFVASGFFAGAVSDLVGPDRGNPLGHYEARAVLEINEELLHRFHCRWWADAPSPKEQLPLRAEMTPRLRSVLDKLVDAADGAPVVVKEPRINSLLPLWQTALEGLLHPVLAIASHLDAPRINPIRYEQAASALQPDLRRQRVAELTHSDFLTGRQAALWQYLSTLPAGDVQLEVPARLRRPSTVAQTTMRKESERIELLETHAALANAHSRAAAQVSVLEQRAAEAITASRLATSDATKAREAAERSARELGDIKTSASWRLTAPLRNAKQTLRRHPAKQLRKWHRASGGHWRRFPRRADGDARATSGVANEER